MEILLVYFTTIYYINLFCRLVLKIKLDFKILKLLFKYRIKMHNGRFHIFNIKDVFSLKIVIISSLVQIYVYIYLSFIYMYIKNISVTESTFPNLFFTI